MKLSICKQTKDQNTKSTEEHAKMQKILSQQDDRKIGYLHKEEYASMIKNKNNTELNQLLTSVCELNSNFSS